MTLLDASVIIDALRAKDFALLQRLRDVQGTICGITRAEVLAGARNAVERSKLLMILDGFHQVAMPDAIWDRVGGAQADLRAKGHTLPLTDVAIAIVAIAWDMAVWAHDAHFSVIHGALPDCGSSTNLNRDNCCPGSR